MHIFFAAARRLEGAGGDTGPAEPGKMLVVRDPDDESEWQYLGNPEVATTTSLKDVVARFIKDCGGAEGSIGADYRDAALEVHDALLAAARQVDDALKRPAGR